MSNWKNRILSHDVVDPNDLVPNEKNWREHPEFQRKSLKGVLDQVGWVQSVIVNKNSGNIVDGHLRVSEAINNKEDVPVVYVDLTSDEENLILATIDPLSALAKTNNDALKSLVEDIKGDYDLAEFGYTSKSLDKLLDSKVNEKPEIEFTEELFESSNYIVLKFGNDIDWLQAQSLFGLKTVKALDSKKGFEKNGVGRVIDGAAAINKIMGAL